MLVSLDHSQGQALDVAAGLALLVDPAGVRLGTVSPARVSIPGLTREEASACPRIRPRQPTCHTAALRSWKTLHNRRICAAADLPKHDATAAPNGGYLRSGCGLGPITQSDRASCDCAQPDHRLGVAELAAAVETYCAQIIYSSSDLAHPGRTRSASAVGYGEARSTSSSLRSRADVQRRADFRRPPGSRMRWEAAAASWPCLAFAN